jgi:hypothetical protein
MRLDHAPINKEEFWYDVDRLLDPLEALDIRLRYKFKVKPGDVSIILNIPPRDERRVHKSAKKNLKPRLRCYVCPIARLRFFPNKTGKASQCRRHPRLHRHRPQRRRHL